MDPGRRVKVLVVDDVEINRIILQEILCETYDIEHACDGIEAVSKLLNAIEKPELVLLDIMMPGMDGFEVLEFMKNDPMLKRIPVIFITAADQEVNGLNAGAADYISKPFEPEIVRLRVSNLIELDLYRKELEGLVEAKANELVATKEIFMETMAGMIEYRSLESGEHIKRTKDMTAIMVKYLLDHSSKYGAQLAGINYRALVNASAIHDVGKIGIPDNILLKPSKLTPEEFKVIETHTTIGGDMIRPMLQQSKDDAYFHYSYEIARHHHERWDGTGYPDKLKGEEIPLSARIVALVDVYDALVNERCYKPPFPEDKVLSIMQEESGTHFDPEIVDAFMKVRDKFKMVK